MILRNCLKVICSTWTFRDHASGFIAAQTQHRQGNLKETTAGASHSGGVMQRDCANEVLQVIKRSSTWNVCLSSSHITFIRSPVEIGQWLESDAIWADWHHSPLPSPWQKSVWQCAVRLLKKHSLWKQVAAARCHIQQQEWASCIMQARIQQNKSIRRGAHQRADRVVQTQTAPATHSPGGRFSSSP